MNAEQLNSARLARWSQNGEARLTLEAATEWLATIGFCPYLPPGATGASPVASFLEAVVGRPAQTPSAGERSRASELLARIVENSAGVPLKLGNSLGEQPDFVASPEALRYIYALLGDRNSKAGPSTVGNDKVTPLALHCWEALKEHGPLDVPALQPILGRDITEAAISRALQELWVGLYVFPVASVTGKPAKWELLSRRFPGQVAAGASTGQAQAQSAMVSLYLHAVVAAAEEEVLAFLSPLAPQSKLREVIRGLGSMRQLDIIDIGGRAHVCLQGGLLPEMVAQLSEEQLGVPPEETKRDTAGKFEGGIEIEREPQGSHEDRAKTGKFVPKKFVPKKFVPRDSGSGESPKRPFRPPPSGARPGFGAAARSSGPRSAGTYASRPRSFAASGGDVPGYMGKGSKGSGYRENSEKRRGFEGAGSGDRKPSTRGPGERAKRWEKSGESAGERPFGNRTSDRKPPFQSSGFRPSGSKSGEFRSAGSGAAKPWASKSPSSGERGAKRWTSRASFIPGAPGGGDSDERSNRWEKSGRGDRASASEYKKPYAAKSGGFKPGGFKSGGVRPGGSSRGGPKPWGSKAGTSRAGAPKRWEESGPGAGEGRPQSRGPSGAPKFAARPAGKKTWGAKPLGRKPSGYTTSGFKSAGARSSENRAAGSKPWVSKGAESRVGSAKSYAARTRPGDGKAPRGPREAYGKTEGTKPWTKRVGSKRPDTERAAADQPKRRENSGAGSGGNAAEKRAAQPFWAKNPRGGKGSVAASRTNRPRGGKKAGGKKK